MKKKIFSSMGVIVLSLLTPYLLGCKKETSSQTNPTQSSPNSDTSTNVKDLNGNVYKTINVGTQTWFKTNLKVSKLNDGTEIPEVKPNEEWNKLNTVAYSYYDNDSSNNSEYGKLYNWYVVNTGKVCPVGWRVPTIDDWNKLSLFLGGDSVSGGKLKEVSNSWTNLTITSSNSSGFTALPGGMRWFNGYFSSKSGMGNWWAQNEVSTNSASHILLVNYSDMFSKSENFKKAGMSIRCIKNN